MLFMTFKKEISLLQVTKLLRAQCTELEKEIDAEFPLECVEEMDKDKYV